MGAVPVKDAGFNDRVDWFAVDYVAVKILWRGEWVAHAKKRFHL
jgi:hypothetical protein